MSADAQQFTLFVFAVGFCFATAVALMAAGSSFLAFVFGGCCFVWSMLAGAAFKRLSEDEF